MKQNAIYARYSSTAQDDGTSIDVQIEQCTRALGGASSQQYIDEARTGRTVAGRDALQRLLDDARAGAIGKVCVWRFSRLGRDLADSAGLIREFEDNGVQVVSAMEGGDPLVRNIFLAMAEHYSRELAQNTRDGLIKRFEQGAWTGGLPPYGYRVIDDNGRRVIQIDAEQAAVVKQIIHEYLHEQVGIKTIARRLRERGVPTWLQIHSDNFKRRGRRVDGWRFTSVSGIIKNPILAGQIHYNRRQMKLNRDTGNRVPKMRPEGDCVVRKDESLRIIDDATYRALQERLETRKRGEGIQSPKGIQPFTGLLHCTCGAKFYSRKSENAKGSYRYYHCGARVTLDRCNDGPVLREDQLLAAVTERLGKVFAKRERILALALEKAKRKISNNRDETARIRREIAAADSDIAKFTAALSDPEVAAVATARRAIVRQLGEAEARRDALMQSTSRMADKSSDDAEQLIKNISKAFDAARSEFQSLASAEQINRFIERFIGPMVVQDDGTLSPKTQQPPAKAEGAAIRYVAGACFVPSCISEEFWQRAA
jgi:site-specific DNA recombinase